MDGRQIERMANVMIVFALIGFASTCAVVGAALVWCIGWLLG